MRGIPLGSSNVTIKVTIKDDEGAVYPFDSATTTITFYFEKPSGAKFNRTGSAFTDGSDGIVQYSVSSTEIDVPGLWSLQVSISDSSTSTTLFTTIYDFRVERQL